MFQKETILGLFAIAIVLVMLAFVRSCSLDIPKANELHENHQSIEQVG